jgi:hypothetical protein
MLIPILIGIALIGYGVIVLICQDADKMYYDATCKGELISIKNLKSLIPNDDLPQQSYKFRFEVDGKLFEGWHPKGIGDENIYIIGRTYRLRYHSKNPKEFTVELKGENRLFYAVSIIGGLLIVILTLLGFLSV